MVSKNIIRDIEGRHKNNQNENKQKYHEKVMKTEDSQRRNSQLYYWVSKEKLNNEPPLVFNTVI